MLDIWRAADDMDVFESAWNFDHFYPLIGDAGGPCMESWVTLTALAQATRRLRVGCMVNGVHYRHPAVVANMAATLDIVSSGRLELGLGAGWHEVESSAYGIELGSIAARMDRFDEAVEVVVALLSQETTTFDGRYYQLRDARCEPKGPQRPHPPIVIGGRGEKRTLRTAARCAQHWNLPFASPEEFTAKRAVLQRHCADVGRDPAEITCSVQLALEADADPSEMADRAAQLGAVGVDLVIFSLRPPYRVSLLDPLASAVRALG
jgi:F420-dependent oxidoreductase-like protein